MRYCNQITQIIKANTKVHSSNSRQYYLFQYTPNATLIVHKNLAATLTKAQEMEHKASNSPSSPTEGKAETGKQKHRHHHRVLPDNTHATGTKRETKRSLTDGSIVTKTTTDTVYSHPTSSASGVVREIATETKRSRQEAVTYTISTDETISAESLFKGEGTLTYLLPDGSRVIINTIESKLADGKFSTVRTRVQISPLEPLNTGGELSTENACDSSIRDDKNCVKTNNQKECRSDAGKDMISHQRVYLETGRSVTADASSLIPLCFQYDNVKKTKSGTGPIGGGQVLEGPSPYPYDSPPIPFSQRQFKNDNVSKQLKTLDDINDLPPDHLRTDTLGQIPKVQLLLSGQQPSGAEDVEINRGNEEIHGLNSDSEDTNINLGFDEPEIFVPEAFLVDPIVTFNIAEVAEIPSAQVVAPEKCSLSLTIAGKKIHAGVLLVIFAVIIALVVGVSTKETNTTSDPSVQKNETITTNDPSGATAWSTSIVQESTIVQSLLPYQKMVKDDVEKNVFRRNATFDSLGPSDPRLSALNWILNTDPMQLNASNLNLHQRYILALLAYHDESIFFDSGFDWLSDKNECEWQGISCFDGNIHKLELANASLRGTIPPEIDTLQFLEVLSLGGNAFFGTIPPEIGNLKSLEIMDLRLNDFTGTLPSELGNLTSLIFLNISLNQLTGTFPAEIGKLEHLTTLHIGCYHFGPAGNNFTGTLPSEIGNLSALVHLDLTFNHFTGTVPSELGKLRELTYLSMSRNQLTGPLPSELRSLTSLKYLDLCCSMLSGTFLRELSSLTSLTDLHLTGNEFYGTLPSELGTLSYLTQLDVRLNSLSGTLPSEIGNLAALTYLDVGYNSLRGVLPSELGKLTALTHLSVDANVFSGTLPSEIGELTALTALSTRENRFRGPLPSEIGKLTALTDMYMESNKFQGTLPSEIGKLTDLVYFAISNNQLTGSLPSEFGCLSNLTWFVISENSLTGTFPSELVGMVKLKHFEFYGNQFNSTSLLMNGMEFLGTPPWTKF